MNEAPKICNHCNSTEIVFHQWGRTEFYSCKTCKKEVVVVVEKQITESLNPWAAWDPKMYGFGSLDRTIELPTGTRIDLDALQGNDSADDGDWL